IYAADGARIATLYGEQNRQPVRLDQLPRHVVRAIIDVEDAGFWVHDGVDARGMLRALRVNVDAGGISQGGSTITQQLVKLTLLDPEQTVDRKVQEVVLALRLEREWSKEEILARYINTVYFGAGAYGIQAAAETYFGVSARELTVDQAALLAGMIRSPNAYHPVRYPERARDRREAALQRMVDVGHLTEDEATMYAMTPLPTQLHQVTPPVNDYFAEAVKNQLLRDPRLGATPEEREQAVFQGGLHIHTTFDPRAQQAALAARDANLPLVDGVFAAGNDPETGQARFGSAAIVSVEPSTGAIRSMVGGPGFDRYRYNLATQNHRNPGSSFKTFVLAALMEQGRSPDDRVNGIGPCRFRNDGGQPNPYEVRNFDNSPGSVDTIRAQTLRSSNCGYVRLGLVAGIGNLRDLSRRLGLRNERSTIPDGISLSLGTASVTPLEMASGYATLANDGVYNPPYMIERVTDSAGRTIIAHQARPERIVSAETARLVTSVLQDNVRSGTATRAAIRTGQPAAAKTGTHQGHRDAWMVGYSPRLATAVWIGGLGSQFTINLGGSGITGSTYPARIWGDYMTAWHEGQEVVPFAPPPGRPGGAMLEVPNGQDLTPAPPPLPPGFPGFPPPPGQGQPGGPIMTLPTIPGGGGRPGQGGRPG
ncbi:MAG TPA: transglycosylase domain-containing protein, partial [Actinomycetes bacterium]|nr:transglycosylase domain-containing protein [Actinomycetes bacterium]